MTVYREKNYWIKGTREERGRFLAVLSREYKEYTYLSIEDSDDNKATLEYLYPFYSIMLRSEYMRLPELPV